MNKKSISVIPVLTFCLFLCQIHSSSAEPLGTAFTYQGRLIDANNPADGEYDFQFKLYDAESNGYQAGEDVNIPDVEVIDGYFTVELDFGNVFTGEARWLEIGVREGDSNDVFTVLSPRQKITASPYALYAASGISSTGSTETDIVTGSKLYNDKIAYIVDIGFVKDVSSEIPPGFTLIDVTAKGRKTDLGGTLLEEAPLNIYPKVNGTNIEIRVWDTDGTEYKDWTDMRAHIEYTLFMKKSGASPPSGKRVVSGHIAYDSSSLPPDFTNLTMPEMEGANSTNTVIIVSGSKIDDTTGNRQPLAITGEVTSSTSLDLQVWETNGAPYNVVAWTGNSGIEISYCVVDR